MRLSLLAPWQRWWHGLPGLHGPHRPGPWRRRNACWRSVDISDAKAGLDAKIRVSVRLGELHAIRGPGHARMLAKLRQVFDGILADCASGASGASGADGDVSPPGGDGRRRGSIDPAAMAGTGSAPRDGAGGADPARNTVPPPPDRSIDDSDGLLCADREDREDREFDALYLGWMLSRAQAKHPASTPEELLATCINARPDVTVEDMVTALETVRSMPENESRLMGTIPLGLAAAPQYCRIRDRIRRKSPEELGINTDKMPPGWKPGDPLPSVADVRAEASEAAQAPEAVQMAEADGESE